MRFLPRFTSHGKPDRGDGRLRIPGPVKGAGEMFRSIFLVLFLNLWIESLAFAVPGDPSKSEVIREEVLFSASGEALGQVASGRFDLLRREDGTVVRTLGSDFALRLNPDLMPGIYRMSVRCLAPSTSTDSFWLEINGERQPQAIVLPKGAYGEVHRGFRLDVPGRTDIRLVLRERPGVSVAQLKLTHLTVQYDAALVIRPDLARERPRLFLTRWDIQRLRDVQRGAACRRLYRRQGMLRGTPPPRTGPPKRAGWAWRMENQAIPCLLANSSDANERFDAIRRHILTICTYDKWLPDGWSHSTPDLDLDAAYMIHGTAIAYDWLYNWFTAEERRIIREKLTYQARLMFEASFLERMYWARTVQQNHYWFDNYAIGVAGAALYGEVPEAEVWMAWSWDRLQGTLKTFGEDGGFHEGPAYWNFSMGSLFRWIDLYEHTTGQTIAYADTWLRKTGYFPIHYVYPDLRSGAAIEDTFRPGVVPSLETLLWLAARNRDPRLFRIAELIHAGKHSTHWWTLKALAADIGAAAGTLDEMMPALAYYPDVEMYFARTSWRTDATMFAFEARPLGGHTLARLNEAYPWIRGVGHNHPAQNSFVLYGNGKELLIDPGYTLKKETANHNTVLVDGQGQYGDGERWPRWYPGWSHIGYASAQFPYVRGEAASAYPPELGLKRFTRQMLMLDGKRILIADHLEADRPRRFTWLLHFDEDAEVVSAGEGRFAASYDGAPLQIDVLTPHGLASHIDRYEPTWNNIARPDYHPRVGRLQLTTGAVGATPVVAVLGLEPGAARPTIDIGPRVLLVAFPDSTRVGFNRTAEVVAVDGLETDGRAVVITPEGNGGRRARVLDMLRYRDGSGLLHDIPEREGEFVLANGVWLPTFPVAPVVVTADFDGNRTVGFSDFLAFAQAFGARAGQEDWDARFDLNGDGEVGFGDFLLFAIQFGRRDSGN